MEKESKIYVAGHTGLVGSAILKQLEHQGFTNIIVRKHKELDLVDCSAVQEFFEEEKPEYVFLAAAKVGGIEANNIYRAEFLYENLMIQSNVIHYSYLTGVQKLMFLGSTCIYPKNSPQPIKEEYLLTGPLEYTNEPYAIAKISGMKMCESYNLQYGTNFISVMPTNLYGPGDNFDLDTSHVLPALLRKIYLGKALEENNWEIIKNDLNKRPIAGKDGFSGREVILQVLSEKGIKIIHENRDYNKVSIEIWGSGKPMREFLWSEDMANACVYIMKEIDFDDIIKEVVGSKESSEIRNTHINIGTGIEISIKELAFLIKKTLDYKGDFYFNKNRPDGTLKKNLDVSKLSGMGWSPTVSLKDGVEKLFKKDIITYASV